MEHAKIVVYDDKGAQKSEIQFDFNPSEFTIDYSPRYTKSSGVASGKTTEEFIADAVSTMSLKLTLNGYPLSGGPESGAKDITASVKSLRALVYTDETTHKPPKCQFQWGSVAYEGHVTNLNVQFTMFTSDGKPVRATVSLTMAGIKNEKLALQSPDRTKRRALAQNTPLFLLAYETYNDCTQWRHIAIANGIRNPRRLEPNVVLKIPPLEPEAV